MAGTPHAQQAPSSHSDAGSQEGQGGSEIDFQALVQQHQQELQETKGKAQTLASELESVKGSAQKTQSQIEKIRAALMGESEGGGESDPVADHVAYLEAEMDKYLEAALEAERSGRPIPLTVNSALSNLKFQIAQTKENAALKKQLADLDGKYKKVSDPGHSIDQNAFSSIDNQVVSALETIYGQDPNAAQIKNVQFEAVTKLIADEIQALKKESPDIWDSIRRDRAKQVKMVNHFVKQVIPPRAREIMEEDRIRKEPMSTEEMMNAWREARELALKDPSKQKFVDQIRQELMARIWDKNAGKSSRLKANDLYGG